MIFPKLHRVCTKASKYNSGTKNMFGKKSGGWGCGLEKTPLKCFVVVVVCVGGGGGFF